MEVLVLVEQHLAFSQAGLGARKQDLAVVGLAQGLTPALLGVELLLEEAVGPPQEVRVLQVLVCVVGAAGPRCTSIGSLLWTNSVVFSSRITTTQAQCRVLTCKVRHQQRIPSRNRFGGWRQGLVWIWYNLPPVLASGESRDAFDNGSWQPAHMSVATSSTCAAGDWGNLIGQHSKILVANRTYHQTWS